MFKNYYGSIIYLLSQKKVYPLQFSFCGRYFILSLPQLIFCVLHRILVPGQLRPQSPQSTVLLCQITVLLLYCSYYSFLLPLYITLQGKILIMNTKQILYLQPNKINFFSYCS